jgi:putative transcriptional regulator
MKKPTGKSTTKGSRVGDDLVEAFQQIAAHMRGAIELESYQVTEENLTPQRIQAIRRS